MKKAVVTGGAGFIGSHIVDELLGSGWEVLIIDNLSTGREENLEAAKGSAGERLLLLDLSINDSRAKEAIVDFKPDVVFHLAAQIDVRKSVREPAFDTQENVVGTVSMLEAAQQSGAKRFVFSSTGGAIYGEQDCFPADEEHPMRSRCPYGVSKRAAELYIEYFAREFDFSAASLRFANVYGPRQNPHGEAGVVAIFTDRAFKGEALKVNGDGGQTRDFVYVADVARACLLASEAEQESPFVVYNVGRGVESSVNQIVDSLRSVWDEISASGKDIPSLTIENGPALRGEQRRSVIDARKISEALGWSPEMELDQGLALTIKSFCQDL